MIYIYILYYILAYIQNNRNVSLEITKTKLMVAFRNFVNAPKKFGSTL